MIPWRIWSDPGTYAWTLTEERAEAWFHRAVRDSAHQLVAGSIADGKFVLLTGVKSGQLIKLARVDGADVPPDGEFTREAIETRQWAIPYRPAVSRETAKNGTAN